MRRHRRCSCKGLGFQRVETCHETMPSFGSRRSSFDCSGTWKVEKSVRASWRDLERDQTPTPVGSPIAQAAVTKNSDSSGEEFEDAVAHEDHHD